MNSPYDTYASPLASRNASQAMLRLWSPRHKFNTWRRIWLAVAEAQHEITSGRGRSVSEAGQSSATNAHPPIAPFADDSGLDKQSPTRKRGRDAQSTSKDPGLTHASGSDKPLVSAEQVAELRAVVERGITDDEIRLAEKYERDLRHDVMAHVHALGDSCPKAKGIVHLGMTSQDVVCNADLCALRAATQLIELKLLRIILTLGDQAQRWKHTPTLGFTHYQPAQPLTVGRRVAQWTHDLDVSHSRLWLLLEYSLNKWRGVRGATGTQAALCQLFQANSAKINELDACVVGSLLDDDDWVDGIFDRDFLVERNTERLGTNQRILQNVKEQIAVGGESTLLERTEANVQYFSNVKVDDLVKDEVDRVLHNRAFALTGQTYPRVIDTFVLSDLASTAAVLHKIATDIRLLSNRKELDEPFEDKQIGSSAMPYKRNPMRCERICGLSRFVMNLVGNAYDTAATQWLERTLDDSSNRRLSLPEAFLALDGALDLMHNVASGLIVHEAMVRRNLMAELPFMATENILMECVKLGGDRQHYHELIRVHAQAAGSRVKDEGLDNDLLDRLQADPAFHAPALKGELNWEGLMDPMKYIGRSIEQTERFIAEVVEPLREQYAEAIKQLDESAPRV